MVVKVGIAAYREPPALLHRLLRRLNRELPDAELVLLADTGDYLPDLRDIERLVVRRGDYAHEKAKRTALIELATPCDWLLFVDVDEDLHGGARLVEALEWWQAEAPDAAAFPLLRQEPDGELRVVSCKLIGGKSERFEYIDIGLRAGGELWNLDPFVIGYGVVVAGWPHLVHIPSRRANEGPDPFYAEPGFLEADRDFMSELLQRSHPVPGAVIVARR